MDWIFGSGWKIVQVFTARCVLIQNLVFKRNGCWQIGSGRNCYVFALHCSFFCIIIHNNMGPICFQNKKINILVPISFPPNVKEG